MASFGERLKCEREKRNVTLDDVSLATKIGTRLLQALEEEKFDQLPGGIFNKGFVRAYARHLGLDENQAVADYLQAAGETAPPDPLAHVHQPVKAIDRPSHAATAQTIEAAAEARAPLIIPSDEDGEESGRSIPWEILAALLLAFALAFSLWGYYTRELPPSSAKLRASSPRNQGMTLSAAVAVSEAPLPAPLAQPQAPGAAATTAPHLSVPSAGAAMLPGSFVLLIHAKDDSWLSIFADGHSVFDDMLGASSEKSIPAQRQIVVKAGNVGGLEFTFNGSKLAPQGADGEVKTLIFGPGGLQPASPRPPG